MNTPPTSPLTSHSFYSPHSSTYDIHTPGSESSFDHLSSIGDSSLYSEPIFRSKTVQPNIGTRKPDAVFRQPSLNRPSVGRSKTSLLLTTMSPAPTRVYRYFTYKKTAEKWDGEVAIEEILASESHTKKYANKKSKDGPAIQQLKNMGSNRRALINGHMKSLNEENESSAYWEPVWIVNTKTKERDNKKDVRAFDVIYALKEPPMVKNPSTTAPNEPAKASNGQSKGDKSKEKKKNKDKKFEPEEKGFGIIDDPFGGTTWIDRTGTALGGSGGVGGPSLPPFIPPEKPIGTFNVEPNIVQVEPDPWGAPRYGGGDDLDMNPGMNPGASLGPGFGMPPPPPPPPPPPTGRTGLDGFGGPEGMGPDEILRQLAEMPDTDEEGEFIYDDEHRRRSRRGRRPSVNRGMRQGGLSRSRSRSRPRRNTSRHNRAHFHDNHIVADDDYHRRERARKPKPPAVAYRQSFRGRPRNVRFNTDHFENAIDSGSSVTSGDIGILWDEVEELSSYTSEGTSETSSGQRIYRIPAPGYRQHRPGPRSPGSARRYELTSDEKVLVPSKSRRRISRQIEAAPPQDQYCIGLDRHLGRTKPVPRRHPIINQANPPPAVPDAPTYPEHADAYGYGGRQQRDRELDEERYVNNYMSRTTRERSLQEREEDVARRERALSNGSYGRSEQSQRLQDLRDQMGELTMHNNRRRSLYTYDPRDNYRR